MKSLSTLFGKGMFIHCIIILPVVLSSTTYQLYAQNPLTIECPGPVTIDCTEDIFDPAVVGEPIVAGGCDPENISFFPDDMILEQGCSYIMERTYFASNACGETAQCSQIITVVDDIPLTLNCPNDFTLATCTSSLLPQQTGGLPSFTDNCSEPEFTWEDVILGEPNICCDPYTIERTWTALDQCNQPATCVQLIFVPGQNCDDGDPCTNDECVDGVCIHTPVLCDDGDPCTTDACVNGDCVFTPVVCDDGDPCTTDECLDGVCVHTPIVCDDGDPCTTDACVNGVCVYTPVLCDDGNPCTTDACVDGLCVFTPLNCDDGDPCTTDICDPNGLCVNHPIVCDDGDPCTTDACVNGECVFTPIVCDDGDPCTTDACVNGVCVFTAVICDDGDPCTTDACVDGLCVFTPVNCDDGDPNTIDACVAGECIHTLIVCDDEDPCTEDLLVAGACIHVPIVCDDEDPCTYDFCDDGTCYHEPIVCVSGDPCMTSICILGECVEVPIVCNDNDPCTTDECVDGQCVFTPINCDDGNPLTIDECVDGICTYTLIDCDDEDPCTLDEFIAGVCTHTPINCDDGDPCTADSCDNGSCLHTPIPGCGHDPPIAVCDYSAYVFIDFLNPDYNGPWLNNIYLEDAEQFDDGSSSNSQNPLMEVRRVSSYINFDWTTHGACVDLVRNFITEDPDKGKLFRTCLPVTPYDIFQWKPYRFRISDEYGTDECTGYYMVIPYFEYGYKVGSMSDILTDDNLYMLQQQPGEWEETNDGNIDERALEEVHVFPNPGDAEIYVTWQSLYREDMEVVMLDITGKTVLKNRTVAQPGKNTLKIETQDLHAGTYIVQFTTAERFRSHIWVKAER